MQICKIFVTLSFKFNLAIFKSYVNIVFEAQNTAKVKK